MKSQQSYEAIDMCIGKFSKEQAKALHLSLSLVHKWQEPSTDFEDSGAFNPLDRIETIMDKALELGVDLSDAMSPLYYLAERFNHIAIPINKEPAGAETVVRELMAMIAEFGSLVRDTSSAMADGVITPAEFRRLKGEGWSLIRQIATFLQSAEQATLSSKSRWQR
jgi:hypothetical protein